MASNLISLIYLMIWPTGTCTVVRSLIVPPLRDKHRVVHTKVQQADGAFLTKYDCTLPGSKPSGISIPSRESPANTRYSHDSGSAN